MSKWSNELNNLCEIADTQPQAAYAAYIKGYRSKFTYFLRTIEGLEEFITPVDEVISEKLLPVLFGTECSIVNEHRDLLALNPSEGGLGFCSLSAEATKQHSASKKITKLHVESIHDQSGIMKEIDEFGRTFSEIKAKANIEKSNQRKEEVKIIHERLPENLKPLVEQACDKGASCWLNALPIKDQNLDLNKEEFKDALRLRYNVPLANLPSYCACGEKFDELHAMSCKKGGFVCNRHDNIRDLLTVCLNKVCTDVQAEPHLIPLSNEKFTLKSANKSDEARLDIKAKGFWRKGETAFFDVRVTHVNSKSSKNQTTKQIFRRHEQEKKREYLERVLEVEHGSFTPLIFGTNGGFGDECKRFLTLLAYKLSEKNGDTYGTVITWLRTRLSMEITRASLLCLRGSRTPFRHYQTDDVGLENMFSGLV